MKFSESDETVVTEKLATPQLQQHLIFRITKKITKIIMKNWKKAKIMILPMPSTKLIDP